MKRLRVSTAGIARASANHPWRTIGIWIGALVLAVGLMGTLLSNALSTETTLTNNPEYARGERLLAERLGIDEDSFTEVVIVQSTTTTVDDPAFRAAVEQLYGDLVALGPELVSGGTHYFVAGDESLVSEDRRTTLIPLTLPGDSLPEIEQLHAVTERTAEASGFEVLMTGKGTLEAEITEVAERDLLRGEGIGISVALVVLALVFGAVVAALAPIGLAIIAIVVALGLSAVAGQVIDLPIFVTNIITMMGLAVGIDYSLFIVSRYREERAKGTGRDEAIAVTGATAGRTVLISGLTVAFTLIGLLITPDSGNQAIGIGALFVVIAAMLGSITLLPAVLHLLGDRINAARVPLLHHVARRGDEAEHGFWAWTTRQVMRRPLLSLVFAGGLLLLAASSYTDMKQGEVGVSTMPDGLMSKHAYVVLADEFGYGQDLPATIVIDGDPNAEPVRAAVGQLEAAIASDSAFVSQHTETHPEAGLTVIRAWLSGDPASQQASDAVQRLRGEHIAAVFDGVPATALVTGDTARFVDITEAHETYTPIVFALVLGLSFLLLTVAFRSVVIAFKAIVMNLLSVAATYGLLVLVFQKGVGADLFGFQQVEVIQTGLPLFMFVVLFGLSMDYHVFLLSRIRERFLETGDNAEAVEYGLRSTGRLITGAALIMVAVFSGFALGDLAAMQQLGFGLAVAVLLDATIVRCILVPASMRLLGRWNWYLPSSLRWLPEFRIELEPVPTEGLALEPTR